MRAYYEDNRNQVVSLVLEEGEEFIGKIGPTVVHVAPTHKQFLELGLNIEPGELGVAEAPIEPITAWQARAYLWDRGDAFRTQFLAEVSRLSPQEQDRFVAAQSVSFDASIFSAVWFRLGFSRQDLRLAFQRAHELPPN